MLDSYTFDQIKQNSSIIKDAASLAYGSGELWKFQNYTLFVLIKTYDNLRQYEQEKEDTKLRMQISSHAIAQLYKYKSKEHQAFCGSYYTISLVYQFSDPSISQLTMTESDYIQVIDDIARALITFNKFKIRHGMISPETIVKGPNSYQLTDIRFLTDVYEYKLQLVGFIDKCYLSPQLFRELGKRTQNPIYNYEKSEIFSLGLVILEQALQQSVQNIYDFDRYLISSDILQTHLRVLSDRYSPKLVSLITKMVHLDEDKRIGLRDLLNQPQSPITTKVCKPFQYKSLSPVSQQPSTPKKRIFDKKMDVQTEVQHQKSQPLKKSTQINYFTKNIYNNTNTVSTKQGNSPRPFLDDKFSQFNSELDALKQKVNHLRINTQSSTHQQTTSDFYNSENMFPTFKPRKTSEFNYVSDIPKHVDISVEIPRHIDISLDDNSNQYDNLQSRMRTLHVDSFQYTTHSLYDDDLFDAKLPQSSTIYMHGSGPAQLNDFFLKKK